MTTSETGIGRNSQPPDKTLKLLCSFRSSEKPETPRNITTVISAGKLVYDACTAKATLTDPEGITTESEPLTPSEERILLRLLQSPSGVYSYKTLSEKTNVFQSNLKGYIHDLKTKISPKLIYNIHKKGYTLTSNEDAVKAFSNNPEYHNGDPLPYNIKRHTTSEGDLVILANRNIAISPLAKDKPFVELEPVSTAVLAKLLEDPSRCFTITELLEAHSDEKPLTSGLPSIKQCIVQLRRTLGDSGATPQLIYAIPGLGYSLNPHGEVPVFNPFTRKSFT